METDVSGASFSEIEKPQTSNYTEYLDTICPYYLMYGMTWDEFWYESLWRLGVYWQRYQFEIERRNQELWLQGLYVMEAVAAVMGGKNSNNKYPEKPHRITEMTQTEKDAEARRKVETLRGNLNDMKRRWDAKHKGESET